MFAVIETGGKQYKVEEGTILDFEKIEGEPQAELVFDKVLMTFDGQNAKIGAPFLEGTTVKGSILEQHRDDKKIVFKMTKKTGYKRTKGHRQFLTRVKILSIQE